jgi:hypothetical protein
MFRPYRQTPGRLPKVVTSIFPAKTTEVDEPQQILITPVILPSAAAAITWGGAALAPPAIWPLATSRTLLIPHTTLP